MNRMLAPEKDLLHLSSLPSDDLPLFKILRFSARVAHAQRKLLLGELENCDPIRATRETEDGTKICGSCFAIIKLLLEHNLSPYH